MNRLIPRKIQSRIEEALKDTPVITIHGPRQSGKSTLAKLAAPAHEYISFDDQENYLFAQTDPVGFVKRLPENVILDEIQRLPELFKTIKSTVDQNRKPGRFILTGSANVLLLPRLSDSLAGRMEVINLLPLASCEIRRSSICLLEKILECDIEPEKNPANQSIEERIIDGGFPEPLQRSNEARKQDWHEQYVTSLIQRDIQELGNIRRLGDIPDFLLMLANHSAQLLNVSSLARNLQMHRKTVNDYLELLRQIFLVDLLPPWYTNRNKRQVKTPKLHLIDTGLACSLLDVNSQGLIKDRALTGHLLETYVYNELKRQASWSRTKIKFYHYRDIKHNEIDIIMETRSGELYAVEVKAASTVQKKDFRIIERFSKEVGKRFKFGVVFYDGDNVFPFGEKMLAVPLSWL